MPAQASHNAINICSIFFKNLRIEKSCSPPGPGPGADLQTACKRRRLRFLGSVSIDRGSGYPLPKPGIHYRFLCSPKPFESISEANMSWRNQLTINRFRYFQYFRCDSNAIPVMRMVSQKK
jgi:hypothetical protein